MGRVSLSSELGGRLASRFSSTVFARCVVAARTLVMPDIIDVLQDVELTSNRAMNLAFEENLNRGVGLAQIGLNKRETKAVKELYSSVARTSTTKTMSQLREELIKIVKASAKLKPDRREAFIKKHLKRLGVGDAVTGNVVKTLVDTHVSIAGNAATWVATQRSDKLWGYEYRARDDARTRPGHKALDGVRYPRNHRFWRRFAPPNGWGCRCKLVPIYVGSDRARIKRFSGTPDVDPEFMFNPGTLVTVY